MLIINGEVFLASFRMMRLCIPAPVLNLLNTFALLKKELVPRVRYQYANGVQYALQTVNSKKLLSPFNGVVPSRHFQNRSCSECSAQAPTVTNPRL